MFLVSLFLSTQIVFVDKGSVWTKKAYDHLVKDGYCIIKPNGGDMLIREQALRGCKTSTSPRFYLKKQMVKHKLHLDIHEHILGESVDEEIKYREIWQWDNTTNYDVSVFLDNKRHGTHHASDGMWRSMKADVDEIVVPLLNNFGENHIAVEQGFVIGLVNTMEQEWHRRFDDNFVVEIPLIEINKTNGVVEFISGSHNSEQKVVNSDQCSEDKVFFKKGDIVIYDSKILKRYGANLFEERLIAYSTYTPSYKKNKYFKFYQTSLL
jgi:hypothetical protein